MNILRKDSLPHVNLIAREVLARDFFSKEREIRAFRRHLTKPLVCRERRLNRQITESLDFIMRRFRMQRVAYFAPEHLIAPADTEERRPRRYTTANRGLKPRRADMEQILGRILRPGQEDEIGTPQLRGRTHIVKSNIRLVCERVKVREVRQFRRADHGNADPVSRRIT